MLVQCQQVALFKFIYHQPGKDMSKGDLNPGTT